MSFTPPPPPVFAGENYNIWAVKMRTYLQAHDLWNVVLNDTVPPPLRANPTIAQIRQHSEDCAKKYKAMSCLQSGVFDAWDKLKKEFQGSDKTRQQQLINLRRDSENLKMEDSETIKQYADRIMATVNNIRLLGEEFSDQRVVEKVITTFPEKYEAKISSLEDSRDLSTIPLTELINALYAQEQRRANRQEDNYEGAFQARSRESSSSNSNAKGKKPWTEKKNKEPARKKFPPCVHCKKTTHLEKYCWYRPDIQCRACKQFGHIEKFVKTNQKYKHSIKTKLKLQKRLKHKKSMFFQHHALQARARSAKYG
ncbi:uncharacterized protein [Gossypium hirsutum]|uniref:DUF4219 domain-containing protein n=1 Tax=Gossypium hirsutum TaxID=3635 RepID=A0ABM3ABZ9_GOSHI|nr:uncharacterized protein LOC121218724 [Gossypium hirsutum]